jgi:hypothetical protein
VAKAIDKDDQGGGFYEKTLKMVIDEDISRLCANYVETLF